MEHLIHATVYHCIERDAHMQLYIDILYWLIYHRCIHVLGYIRTRGSMVERYTAGGWDPPRRVSLGGLRRRGLFLRP